jgi:hypothetical protein
VVQVSFASAADSSREEDKRIMNPLKIALVRISLLPRQLQLLLQL